MRNLKIVILLLQAMADLFKTVFPSFFQKWHVTQFSEYLTNSRHFWMLPVSHHFEYCIDNTVIILKTVPLL